MCSGAVPAFAATYYVATNGNDSNNGSQGSPFRTVQKAVGMVRPGDTVIIKPGRYPRFSLNNINGAAGALITIKGEPGAIVDLNLSGGVGTHGINISGGSYVTFDGLEITDSYSGPGPTSCAGPNAGLRPDAIKLNTQAGKGTPYPHHMTFKNLHIHSIGGTGIKGAGEHIHFQYNHVHDGGGKIKGWSTSQESYGTYLKGRYNIIQGNRIHDMAGNAIRTGNTPQNVGTSELLVDSIIENNLIYNNGSTNGLHPWGQYGTPEFRCEPVAGGDGIVVWHGSGNTIRNNVVYNSVGYGIRVNENFGINNKPNLVYNNTVYKSGAHGIYCYTGDKTIVKNNISYLSGRENIFSGCTNQLSNNLTSDPRLVNPAGGDFHLQTGSPAIDAGVTLSEVPNDFYWGARPFGAAYDIGAIEQGAPPGQAPDGGELPPGDGSSGGVGGVSGGSGIQIITQDQLCLPDGAPVRLNIRVIGPDGNNGGGNDPGGIDPSNPGGGN